MAPRVRWTSRSPESCRHRSTGALCFPVSRILYEISFRRSSPTNTAAFLRSSKALPVFLLSRQCTQPLFCFAQMNLSTSTLVKTATVHGISMIILIDNHRVSYLLKMLVSFRIVPILILESLFARDNQILKQLPR